MNVKELVMLIIPSLVGVTGYGILQYYLNIYEKDTGKSLTDTYGFYGTLSFVHYFISIIAILVMTTMFQNWKVAQEEQDVYKRQVMAWADEFRTLKVRTNADTPADAKKARELGAEGIGLCRTRCV